MVVSKVSSGVLAVIFAFICAITMAAAQSPSPAPAPAPASDGTSQDQGIAFAMMVVALLVSYLIFSIIED